MGGDPHFPDGLVGRRVFDLEQVRRFGKYASHRTSDGRLFEYDQGRFWVSHVAAERDERVQVADDAVLPDGPWRHSPVCGCRACVPRMGGRRVR